MSKLETQEIQLGKTSIHTIQAGRQNEQSVILLHGKAFQAETWKDLNTISLLANAGFHVIALDLPGFGKSADTSFDADDLLTNFIKETEAKKPILIGPSMGGKIALECALNHPEILSALILVGAVGVTENQDRLSSLSVKTLIVWGENDHISNPENATILNREIPDSQLTIIKDAKHACYLEQPEMWHKTLINFVSECKS